MGYKFTLFVSYVQCLFNFALIKIVYMNFHFFYSNEDFPHDKKNKQTLTFPQFLILHEYVNDKLKTSNFTEILTYVLSTHSAMTHVLLL